jgi:lipopolysaccharide biosynthesis regulator YciM
MTNLLSKVFVLTALVCANAATAQTHADGLTAMQFKDWDKAVNIYSALTKANPADQMAYLSLGSALISKGENDKAKAAYEAAFNAKPEGALAFIANGRIMLLQNNIAEADKQFAKAAKSGKKDVGALRQIGESYLYANPGVKPNFTRSEELLKAAVDVGSKDIPAIMTLGYCYKEMPNGGLAAQQYELAESIEQKNPLIKFMLAKVYKAAKLPERFVTMAEKTLALNPKYTPALRALSDYYYFDFKGAGKWEKALETAQNLVSNATEPIIEDEMVLANCLFINKKYPECSAAVEKIIAKDASKNYLRRLLAYTSYETGDYTKSLSMLNDYFKIAPADKILWTDFKYLGESTLKTKGDTSAAIGYFRKAIAMDTSGQAWSYNKTIGDILYSRKDNCGAVPNYKLYVDSLSAKVEDAKPEATDYYKYGLAQYFCKDDTLRYVKAEAIFNTVIERVPKAGLGYLWSAKSAAKQDPDIEARPELLDQFGKAVKYYEKYIEIAAVDATTAAKNKKDLIDAYGYFSYLHLKKGDMVKSKEMVEKILVLDPANATYLEMKTALEGGVAPATPVPPPGGGGQRN